MADTLVASEILGIWKRIRRYLDIDSITATDKMNQQKQLQDLMTNPSKGSSEFPGNMDTLVDNGFPSEFVGNPEIRNDLLSGRIREIKVRGTTRFQIAGGTPFVRGEGKSFKVRGGLFLPGTSREKALEGLKKRLGEE